MELEDYLKSNVYPGRFLLCGETKDGLPVVAYAIMGRSESSRNRVFRIEDGTLKTLLIDETKVEDPSLIIYNAKVNSGNNVIVTNGAQTDTIKKALDEGRALEEALEEHTYEPDAPSYTSRISLVLNEDDGSYSLSIIRKKAFDVERAVWSYEPRPLVCHVIHTYAKDGNPLPPFKGEPKEFTLPCDNEEISKLLWSSLDENNKIALYVKIGTKETVINKYAYPLKTTRDTLRLKYGCNPSQTPAYLSSPSKLPVKVLNGKAGYINFLDALQGWKLVKELKVATGLSSASSFKHTSPAGAAVAVPLSEAERKMYFVGSEKELSPLATAFVRARGADRMSSFGDFIALSDICDESTARAIKNEVSDGVIAPGYTSEALSLLKQKRNGDYTVLELDEDYIPPSVEHREIYGLTFTQGTNLYVPAEKDFENIVSKNKDLPPEAILDLKVALVALKYTQSNSVVYAMRGQTVGVGAGQQSRIHCTRLAGDKADKWNLRQSEKVLFLPFKKTLTRNDKDNVIEQYLLDDPEIDLFSFWGDFFTEQPKPFTKEEKKEYLATIKGLSLASDAFFPFSDNIIRASRSGVSYITEPGGSIRDDEVISEADRRDITLIFSGVRLFHH